MTGSISTLKEPRSVRPLMNHIAQRAPHSTLSRPRFGTSVVASSVESVGGDPSRNFSTNFQTISRCFIGSTISKNVSYLPDGFSLKS